MIIGTVRRIPGEHDGLCLKSELTTRGIFVFHNRLRQMRDLVHPFTLLHD